MSARLSPSIALLDPDDGRRDRFAARAVALGLPCRAHADTPATPDPGVRVVLALAELDEADVARLRLSFPGAAVVAGAADPSQDAAVRAFRAGVDDFLWLGAPDAEVARLLGRLLNAPAVAAEDDGGLVGGSPAMREVRALLRRVAPSRTTVLVSGETGTGKDLAALLLHRLSARAAGPLVALNCAAIPEALLEGELFGYERGAFSGALSAFPGRLKLADGGTLFLDEIGELSLAGQAKILRAIETREAWRLGARAPTRFDVRIVAATNRDLLAEAQAGRFRLDLFYRIAVAQIRMPALRERPEDIGAIARYILSDLAAPGSSPILDDTALRRLEAHGWPGNARELRNLLEVALVTCEGARIRAADLGSGLHAAPAMAPADAMATERARLRDLLVRVGGNKKRAAAVLNCSRMTLYRRLARCGLKLHTADGVAVSQVSRGLSRAVSHEA